MVNNQEADFQLISIKKVKEIEEGDHIQLISIEKGKQKVDEFGLWAKLKIPEEEGPEEEEEEEEEEMDVRDVQKRVCNFCQKVFNSGKALGGHMRVHAQTAHKKDLDFKVRQTIKFRKQNPRDEKVKKTTCMLCGRDFPSMKSLFGHMRCHPERVWRGINPPLNTSSSSSSLTEVRDDIRKLLTSRAVDLTESLSGWVVTARRGRKALTAASSSELSSLEDDTELLEAANDLVMLSRGDPLENGERKMEESEAANSFSKAKVVEKADKQMVQDLEQNYLSDDYDSKNQGIMNDRDSKMVNKNKKRRKKMKLCDLEMDKNGSPVASDKYKCSTCDKSFSTFQALGGHRSSHNKFTIVIRNSNEGNGCINPFNHPITQVEENNKICSKNSLIAEGFGEGLLSSRHMPSGSNDAKIMLDFDLNELPPPED